MAESRSPWWKSSAARAALGWLLVLALAAALSPGFFALEWRDGRVYGTLVDVLLRSSPTLLAALGMTLVIGTGGVDLSVGAVAAISGVLAARHLQGDGSAPTALTLGLGAGVLLGAWNGVLVRKLGLVPIVATLVLFTSGRGLAQLVSAGNVLTFRSDAFASLAAGTVAGLPNPIWLTLASLATLAFVVRRTNFGLYLQACGDNPRAAELAGLPVSGVLIAAYACCGMLAALSGLVVAADVQAGDAASAGLYLELDAILAVVIGGTSLRGGRVQLVGTAFGVLILQTLTTLVLTQGARLELALIAKALAVVAVCALQSPRWGELLRRGARTGAAR